MTDQTTETRVAEIEKRAVDALGIGAFGKAVLVCRSDIPWLTDQLRAAWKREAALRETVEWYGENARLCRLIHSGGDEGRKALSDDGGNRARTALQETADER